eukprot:8914648-Pyramimonas_sp.AAC.1
MVLASFLVFGAYRLSDAGLASVLRGAPALSSLTITYNPRLTVEGLSAIAGALSPTLRRLVLDGCSGLGCPDIANGAPPGVLLEPSPGAPVSGSRTLQTVRRPVYYLNTINRSGVDDNVVT